MVLHTLATLWCIIGCIHNYRNLLYIYRFSWCTTIKVLSLCLQLGNSSYIGEHHYSAYICATSHFEVSHIKGAKVCNTNVLSLCLCPEMLSNCCTCLYSTKFLHSMLLLSVAMLEINCCTYISTKTKWLFLTTECKGVFTNALQSCSKKHSCPHFIPSHGSGYYQ